MQGLKALVIFMGVLIVIGMGGLGYGLVVKFGKNAKPDTTQISTIPVIEAPMQAAPQQTTSGSSGSHYKGAPTQPFGDVDALLPADAEIIQFIPNKRRLLIIYKDSNGARAVKVVDVANGNDLGTIHLDKSSTLNEAGAN